MDMKRDDPWSVVAEDLEDRAARALGAVMRSTRGGMRAHLERHGLTFPQAMLLRFLARRGPAAPARMAERVGVSRATITGAADRLEAAGLVTRRRSEEDRRSVELRITPKGRRLVAELAAAHRAALRGAFRRLKPAEVRRLVQLLERMAPPADRAEAGAPRRPRRHAAARRTPRRAAAPRPSRAPRRSLRRR